MILDLRQASKSAERKVDGRVGTCDILSYGAAFGRTRSFLAMSSRANAQEVHEMKRRWLLQQLVITPDFTGGGMLSRTATHACSAQGSGGCET